MFGSNMHRANFPIPIPLFYRASPSVNSSFALNTQALRASNSGFASIHGHFAPWISGFALNQTGPQLYNKELNWFIIGPQKFLDPSSICPFPNVHFPSPLSSGSRGTIDKTLDWKDTISISMATTNESVWLRDDDGDRWDDVRSFHFIVRTFLDYSTWQQTPRGPFALTRVPSIGTE